MQKTVALLFGGRSSEHGISCVTAASVYAAIDKDRYRVLCVGITPAGEMVHVDPAVFSTYTLNAAQLPQVSDALPRVIWPLSTADHTLYAVGEQAELQALGQIDVVLPMLHGPFGEDGTVQGLCALADLPYTGSGVLGSALCMDKNLLKVVLQAAGVPVAPWHTITSGQVAADPLLVKKLAQELTYPVFVKPARAGSSVGVSKVAEPEQLAEAVATALNEDRTALIETAVVGREVEIGILELADGSLQVSPHVGEIVFNGREFYDFAAKYLGAAGCDVVLPAAVTEQEYAQLAQLAKKAFQAADCGVYARLDFFLTEAGPVLNEINTLPGFTPVSMFPRLWEGEYSYTELLTQLLESAFTATR